LITNPDGEVVQHVEYVPFGEVFIEERNNTWNTPYLFNAKELDEETGLYYYGARYFDPRISIFLGVDPMWEKYPGVSAFAYCLNNPLKYIDPTGLAWRPTFEEDQDGNRTYNGYEWIDEAESYNEDGTLKTGLYAQAIFFSDNATFDASSSYNMGSSTASVYLADGKTTTFDANTNPSSSDYATVPEGIYHATVGKHKGDYTALKMKDIDAASQTIELGEPNPAHPERTYATGINIHKPGKRNLTGTYKDENGKIRSISEGCLLIDRNNWSSFIGIFDTDAQRSNTVSVTVSRSMATPTNVNRLPAFNFFMNGTRRSFFSPY
jgi:RHS repeat-associated protein